MADDLASSKYTGRDPVHSGELNHAEIERGQADPTYSLKMQRAPVDVSRTKGPRYTPVSKRAEKPDGIAYLIKHYPDLLDAQIARLLGTTKETIAKVRDRTHWNSSNIKPNNPVLLGLCKQADLDAALKRAQRRIAREQKGMPPEAEDGETVITTEEAPVYEGPITDFGFKSDEQPSDELQPEGNPVDMFRNIG